MEEYTVKYGQNIFDLAIQLYGHISGIKYLLKDNVWVTMDTDLDVGDIILFNRQLIINLGVVTSLNQQDIIVSNGKGTYEKEKEGFTYTFDYKLS